MVLFWDFDGTLIHANESFVDSFEKSLVNFGISMNRKVIRQLMQAVCSWYFPSIEYTNGTGEKWWGALFSRFQGFYDANKISDRNLSDKVNKDFKTQIIEKYHYEPYDDAISTLAKCKQMGANNYILSNNFPELSDVVKRLGMGEYISGYFVSALTGYEKPNPRAFLTAMKEAGVKDSMLSNVLMIGDNPVADIEGAKNVGMKTILVHSCQKTCADFICEQLSEIPYLLHDLK